MDVDDDDEEMYFVVESIVNSRRVQGNVQYRVRWQGFGEESDTWEPIENFMDTDVVNFVLAFHKEHLKRPVHRLLEYRL